MSTPKPFDPEAEDANIFYFLIHELIHAQSSLNMPPEPIKQPRSDAVFLSETDGWAAHAMQHLHTAFDAIHIWEKYDPAGWNTRVISKWIEESAISKDVRNARGLSRKVLKLLEETMILKAELDEVKIELEEYNKILSE